MRYTKLDLWSGDNVDESVVLVRYRHNYLHKTAHCLKKFTSGRRMEASANNNANNLTKKKETRMDLNNNEEEVEEGVVTPTPARTVVREDHPEVTTITPNPTPASSSTSAMPAASEVRVLRSGLLVPEVDSYSVDSSDDSSSWNSVNNRGGSSSNSSGGGTRRSNKCFPFCPINIVSPSCAARLLLRNMVVPKEMWDEFPDGLSYHISDYFLYQPNMPKEARLFLDTPKMYEMPYEDVWMVTKDKVKIHGFLVKQERDMLAKVPTIIFFHGNAGNIGHRLDNTKLLHEQLNCNVLLVEYRGFGKSEGNPSEKGLYADAQAAFQYVESRADLDPKKIIIFGRSLGGAVAIDLCVRSGIKDRVAALIVENTFSSIPDLAKTLFDIAILRWVPHWCYKNRYESLRKVEKLTCPTFFISGIKDEMLPIKMMEDLHDSCGARVKELTYFEGSHNETYVCEGYAEEIGEYFKMAKIDYPKISNLGCSSSSNQVSTSPVETIIM